MNEKDRGGKNRKRKRELRIGGVEKVGQNSSIMREPLLGKVGERKCETNTHTLREREREKYGER